MFGKASPEIKKAYLQEIDGIAQCRQDLGGITPLTEIGEEGDQRKGKMGKTNFILVVWFVYFPAKSLGVTPVKNKMAGETEKTYDSDSADDDRIDSVLKILAKQLIVA